MILLLKFFSQWFGRVGKLPSTRWRAEVSGASTWSSHLDPRVFLVRPCGATHACTRLVLRLTQLALLPLLHTPSIRRTCESLRSRWLGSCKPGLWSLHDAARAESECDSLVASESGDVCCEREQILVFQNLSDAQKMALCGDWHSAEAGTRVVAAATVFGAATRDHVFNILERLSQDSLAIVASYVAVVDLRLIVSHSSDGIPDRLPRWDDNFRRSQAFMRAFGSQHCRPEGHPLRWYIRTQPIETTWVVLFYTSHLDLGAMIRLASVSKRMVKPMARVTQRLPVVNVRHIPHISCFYNTNFEWIKSTRPDTYDHNYIFEGVGLEICRFDYKVMTHLRSQRLRPPDIFYR